MGTLGILWTSTGGQNGRKTDQKNVTMGENEKKLTKFTDQVFYLVGCRGNTGK